MKKISIVVSFLFSVILFQSCNDDEVKKLEKEIEEITAKADSLQYSQYLDSLEFVLAMKALDYSIYVDSLIRVDSLTALSDGKLPFTYNIVVFEGSNTSVGTGESTGGRKAEFDTQVTVTISQFGQTQTVVTTNGLAQFENVGRGIINGSISATNYTTLEFSTETLIRPTQELIDNEDYMDYVINSSLGHTFAIFAITGENSNTLIGRATVETDLTNSSTEFVPSGTVFLASIDVENVSFKETYLLNINKTLFTDNLISFGYSPVFKSSIDASGDYSFLLPASPSGLPIRLVYSDFISNQVAYVQDNGDLTERTVSAVYGPDHTASAVPTTTLAPIAVFEAGGGALATAEVSGTGSITAINLINGGQNFQGTPQVIISAPATAGGTQATATATFSNGTVTGITLTDGGNGYISSPLITISEGAGALAQVSGLYPIDIDSGSDIGGGVGTVQLSSSGVYWSNGPVSPFVLFNGVLEGSVAGVPDVSVNMNNQGNVANVVVIDRGYGYTGAPTVGFSVGQGATAQVGTVDGTGAITSVTITSPGQFYAAIDDIIISSSGGSGAQLTIQIDPGNNFGLSNIQIANAGSGYSPGDGVTFVTALVNSASATAVWEGQSIESYQITAAFGGTNADLYINTPLVVFSAPDYNGPGARRALGTAVISNGRLTGIQITDNGRGYYNFPTISILSGSGALAQTEFDEMKISGFSISDQGSGYLAAPDILIIDQSGAGTSATAIANLTDGRVTSIALTNSGSGYINVSSIEVIFLDPGTSYDAVNKLLIANPAEAAIEVTDGVISSVNVISGGSNYKAANILIESTKGSGFAGTVTIANGRIADVVVGNGGVGYVNGNNPGLAVPFSGTSSYSSYSGITRVLDVNYGTGLIR
ncbi:MAG: hypothetical protein ACJA08_002264 [Cyclobacteriaceae bacterium]|jgi:hypothetical protein